MKLDKTQLVALIAGMLYAGDIASPLDSSLFETYGDLVDSALKIWAAVEKKCTSPSS